MTVKKRLFWSNILMILTPVIATALIGSLCVGIIWLSLVRGAGLGLDDQEDFDRACRAVTEVIAGRLDAGLRLSPLDELLDGNGMSVAVLADGQPYYAHGEESRDDRALRAAADLLENSATVTQNGRSLFTHRERIGGRDYEILVYGGNTGEKTYATIKVVLAMSAVVIIFTIFLSILLTNRFLTRFVFRKIEMPLDILTNGVHEIRDGNLDFRIAYDGHDEFVPVCADFNEMAERLKESVERTQQQETSRKELIAGISHDIRSPLTSIQAYVEGLLDGVARTPETQRQYLRTIKTKVGDLNHIVSQLFLFSKMELGEYPENPRLLRLDERIGQTVAAVRDEYRQKGLSIELDMEPVSLWADPVQIERVTENILENSLKYKDKDLGRIIISLRQTDTGVHLSFADDGPGVSAQALPHLFEVFYRSDPARANPTNGSGLGLAIVSNAVRRMGGTTGARSSGFGGLEIYIDFPTGGAIHG